MDYTSHDIVVAQLSTAESGVAFDAFFAKLKSTGYPLTIVVADDRSAITGALKRYFPEALIQRCQGHYLENIRQVLHLRTDKSQSHFFNSLKKHVFDEYENREKLDEALHHVLTERCDHDPLKQAIVMDISKRREELFAYKKVSGCPPNTNLIELYNSHLNGRLKTIKGFKSFHAAERWLNAYVLRRRTKKLTDCGSVFKHLNGTCSLQNVLKPGIDLSTILVKKRTQN
jgi:transposase-like protein